MAVASSQQISAESWALLRQALTDFRFDAPSFDVLEMFGIARSERPHAAALAYFLDPSKPHGLGRRFLDRFCDEIAFSGFRKSSPRLFTEWMQIDVLAETGRSQPALGIEVKIDAKEQLDQLARYRATLKKHFGPESMLVFLTIDGREGETTDPDSDVTCIPLSWTTVIDWLDECAKERVREGVAREPAMLFLEHLTRNIRRWTEVVSENERRQIEEILADPEMARALRLIERGRKKIKDEASRLQATVEKVVNHLDDRFRVSVQGSSSPASNEIHVKLRVGTEAAGAGFTLVFHHYSEADWFPGIHLLLDAGQDVERNWDAVRSEHSQFITQLIHPPGWTTDKFLFVKPDGYDEAKGFEIMDESFGDRWYETAESKVRACLEAARPLFESISNGDA